MAPFVNAYTTLGLSSKADAYTINAVFYERSQRTDPERAGNSQDTAAEFSALKDAYEALIDPVRREAHDEIIACRKDEVYQQQIRQERRQHKEERKADRLLWSAHHTEQLWRQREKYEARIADAVHFQKEAEYREAVLEKTVEELLEKNARLEAALGEIEG